MTCETLNSEALVAYLDGELGPADTQRVAAHLGACTPCAREAELLGRSGELVAGLPRHDPGAAFAERVSVAARRPAARSGSLLRMWPAAAAAAVLIVALAARTMIGRVDRSDALLTAAEERAIASDLYVLAHLESLESVEPDELILLVDQLDLLEGLEPELSGLYAAADAGEGG
jgi:anti-sigma factor RsiW